MERGSKLIEPRDLIKAIYIVDLDHVSHLWNDWEGFERLITQEKLGNGTCLGYVNRTLYLVQMYRTMDENTDTFIPLGHVSEELQEIFAVAKQLAVERAGPAELPTSRDLLYSVCSRNADLSEALQTSGLQLEKLTAAVGRDSDPK